MKPAFNPFIGNLDWVQDFSGQVPYTGATEDLDMGAHDVQATEFRMGTDATIKFNSTDGSIDFIIN